MKMKIFIWSGFAALLMLAGCATYPARLTGSGYGNQAYAPTDPTQVKLYKDFPPQPHEKIGEVELSAPDYTTDTRRKLDKDEESTDTFETKLRQKTAELGGDGLVITKDEPYDFTSRTIKEEKKTDAEGIVKIETQINEPLPYGRKVFGYVIKFR